MAINQSFQAAQREIAVKELESKLKQVIDSNMVQEQLLMHVVHQANENIKDLIESTTTQERTDNYRSGDTSRSTSPVDSLRAVHKEKTFIVDNPRKKKARKVAATTEDLLFSGGTYTCPSIENLNLHSDEHDPLMNFPAKPSEPVISGQIIDEDDYRERYYNINIIESSRSNDSKTLTHFSSAVDSNDVQKGEIKAHISKYNRNAGNHLLCSHVATGHSKAVLCVECTEDVLFSSSRDRTVKIWDLNTGKEIQQLGSHPGNVVKVRYCEYTRLAFTASMSYIKIWDVRENPSSCVQTLCSSGVAKKGSMTSESLSKYSIIPPGESQINDIALNHYGTTLFSASTGTIRMWDLKMFQSIGALNAGFQSVVMCLAVDDIGLDKNMVVSGAKDSSVKVFEVMEGSRGVHSPKFTLTPPHYDSIESLAINGEFLYSTSRDMSIKKWDLRKRCVEQSLLQAHNDSIYSLNVLPSGNLFLSGCRSGMLNLWSADKCDPLEKINAHAAAINSIASTSTCIFTASNDCTIGVWKLASDSSGITPDHNENEMETN